MAKPMWTDRIAEDRERPQMFDPIDPNENARGLEDVARGAFSGTVNNLDASAHGSVTSAVTVINFRTKDNSPQQFTVTLASPLAHSQVQEGNASALVEWGSGGFNSAFVCDAREGQQFCLTCSSLRVSIFNDALAQGYDPNNLVGGISNPITFGAFVSLGNGVNRRELRRSEVRVFTTLAPEFGDGGLVPGIISEPFIVPKHASDFKVYPYPQNDFIAYQINPKGRTDGLGVVHHLALSTEVLAGNDCPVIALVGDTKQVTVENAGTSTIAKLAVVWGLSV